MPRFSIMMERIGNGYLLHTLQDGTPVMSKFYEQVNKDNDLIPTIREVLDANVPKDK